MKRASPILLLVLFLSLVPARAADYADRTILGFSPDGRYFAFEQFGRQDGSGFPYTDIFMIDTGNDSWVDGSPVRVLLRDERAEVKWARREAITKGGNLLKKLLIAAPGRLLASNPPGEISAEPHSVTVNARFPTLPEKEPWTFVLEEIPFASPRCTVLLDGPAKGFRLIARREGQADAVWHLDSAIPESRGCPLRYAISDVIIHEPKEGARVFVVLISVYAFGFEGADRRFLAVTRQVP